MNTLFWQDCPEKNDFPWAMERVRRCELQAGAVASDLIRCGRSSVLDMGFTTRAQRQSWVLRAQAAQIPVGLHSLELPAELRWIRVEERNHAVGGTFVFPVTREMFDGMERMWEPPTEEEGTQYRTFSRIAASDSRITTT